MARIKDKRFRVSGYDDEGDIHAFETDDRQRALDMEQQMKEDLKDVALERIRYTV